MASAASRLHLITRSCIRQTARAAPVERCISTAPQLLQWTGLPRQAGSLPSRNASHAVARTEDLLTRRATRLTSSTGGRRSVPSAAAYRTYSSQSDWSEHTTTQDVDTKASPQQTLPEDTKSTRKIRTHEDIYNLPNFLTVTRLIAAPTTAYLLIHDYNTAALALFAYAGITDFIDGWLARRWKLSTVAGSVMDPMADKALMIILTATLAVKGAIPLALATLILGRDASMGVAAIYYRWASLPPPKTFMRYWDFSLPSAEVHPTQVSKQNTFLQLILIGSTLALPVVTAHSHHLGLMHDLGLAGLGLHAAMTWLQVTVAATTLWSGLSYVTNTEAVRMLPRAGDEANSSKKDRRGLIGRSIIGMTFGSVIILAAYQMNESIRKEMMEDKRETAPKVPSK